MIDLISQHRQYCTFRLDQYHCGVDVLGVREILRHQTITPVPLAHPVVKGLINLRGQIITAIDLRIRLGFPSRPERKPPIIIVVDIKSGEEGSTAALLVDEIGDVIDIDPVSCEAPPDTMHGAIREFIQAVCKREQGLMLIIDLTKMIAGEK